MKDESSRGLYHRSTEVNSADLASLLVFPPGFALRTAAQRQKVPRLGTAKPIEYTLRHSWR